MAIVLVCMGFAFWQEQQIKDKDFRKAGLQSQLSSFDLRVDKNLILKLVDRIRAQNQNLRGIGNNFLGVAVLGEVANTTPANVRLLNVTTRLGAPPALPAAGKAAGKAEPAKRVVILEGVIYGDRTTLEAELAAYLMALKSSALFKQAAISKKSVETMDNQPVIRFTAQMDLA
jgi:hypothetical protein